MTDVVATPALAPEWVCVGCRARVAVVEDECPSCGRAFGEGLALGGPAAAVERGRLIFVIRELVVLNVLFIIWRVVGRVSVFHEAGAFDRGRGLWSLERSLHLPSEASIQRPFLAHDTLARIANGYYEYAHAALLLVMLLWLLWRHREHYARWRNLVVAFTGVSLLIGLMPVAPPRLIPSFGMVDLGARYHESVYSALGKGITDQLSSMPSVHVGWAVIVAAAVIAVSRSRWRWLALAHPVITAYVVVVTANHYWLDGIAAVALLGVIVAARRWWQSRLVPLSQ